MLTLIEDREDDQRVDDKAEQSHASGVEDQHRDIKYQRQEISQTDRAADDEVMREDVEERISNRLSDHASIARPTAERGELSFDGLTVDADHFFQAALVAELNRHLNTLDQIVVQEHCHQNQRKKNFYVADPELAGCSRRLDAR